MPCGNETAGWDYAQSEWSQRMFPRLRLTADRKQKLRMKCGGQGVALKSLIRAKVKLQYFVPLFRQKRMLGTELDVRRNKINAS